MPKAALRSQQLQQESIDVSAGVIFGVKVAQNKHLARFNSPGGVKQITITENHIGALKDFAGNRAIPVHWTHDYLSTEKDRLHVKVGALKNLRTDDEGNLVADLHVAPTEYRDRIFWNAANDPDGMMLSAVFDYGAHDPECTPLSFDAADLVAEGAGVKALFSKTQETDEIDMKPEDLQKLVADTVTATLAAAKPQQTDETAALAAAEKEAGVTDADRKDSDSAYPASAASAIRIQRATMRQAKSAATLSKADILGTIGGAGFNVGSAGGGEGDESIPAQMEKAIKAQMEAGASSRGMAKFRIAKDKPMLYAQWSKMRDAGVLSKV